MKIRVEREKIIQALRKAEGIDVVLENENDAKEAIEIVFGKSELFSESDFVVLNTIHVAEIREYETSSVAYKIFYLLEFPFTEDVPNVQRASLVKKVQSLFESR
ncbi:MAG: hypothetical protein PHU03_01780 [Syntrophales bacterium]|nr:hypothetical protein [Syntrophales bacterium]